ncbi:hypothetical protein ABZ297_17715 [Nonomuraea sp. NPDC005983]|uniref:hypothetical protein n=1 Tax=Nonomuraea sp. NPDC005983 TaxID=3155595 RepID=UPI0033B196CD
MYALGTERFRHRTAELVYQKDTKKQRAQAALGKALGAAGSRLGPSWRKELLTNLRVPVDQHALAALLPHGTFNRDFLIAAAKTLEALEAATLTHRDRHWPSLWAPPAWATCSTWRRSPVRSRTDHLDVLLHMNVEDSCAAYAAARSAGAGETVGQDA